MTEMFDFFGSAALLQPFLMIFVIGFVLYLIFAKDRVSLTSRRLIRMYLYLFLFLGIIIVIVGLSSTFRGAFGLLFTIEDTNYPSPVPLTQHFAPRGNLLDNVIVDGETDISNDSIISPGPPPELIGQDQTSQRSIVFGITSLLIGLIISAVHFLGIRRLERDDSSKLLRKIFAASGMVILGLVIVGTLLGLANDISYTVVTDIREHSLVRNLATLFAAIPGWLVFAYAGYDSLRGERKR